MAELPAPSKRARKLQVTGNGLQGGEHVFTAIRFHRNRAADYNTFTLVARYVGATLRNDGYRSPYAAPPLATRVGRYGNGLLAITNLHLLLYRRRGFGYTPEESFWAPEIRSIAPAMSRMARAITIVFADGSSCEIDAGTGRERDHFFEVLDALRAIDV